jgi:hypothetical protein
MQRYCSAEQYQVHLSHTGPPKNSGTVRCNSLRGSMIKCYVNARLFNLFQSRNSDHCLNKHTRITNY